MSKFYHDDPAWADIEPIPQDDTGRPLVAIAYTAEYSEAMGYLRAVMAKNEYSQRVLDLTEHIISINPAHYTVWLYRARTLQQLAIPPSDELRWLNPIALDHLKNYQIWNHRQAIVDRRDSCEGEPAFIAQMLEQDAKNYHVWSYRQWMVERFGLWRDDGEVQFADEMIKRDVRNNSAWNHRFFVLFGKGQGREKEIVEREIQYGKTAVRQAPQSQSAWDYLRGVLRHAHLPISTITDIAQEYTDVKPPRSLHALEVQFDIYAEEKKIDEAESTLAALAEFDPIRKLYWGYRQKELVVA